MAYVDDKQKERFADRLKFARLHRRITQSQFAELLNCKQQEISRYEKGKYFPNNDSLEAMAKVLSVNAEWLSGKMSSTSDYSYENDDEAISFNVSVNKDRISRDKRFSDDRSVMIEQIKASLDRLLESDLNSMQLYTVNEILRILEIEANPGEDSLAAETYRTFAEWGDLEGLK